MSRFHFFLYRRGWRVRYAVRVINGRIVNHSELIGLQEEIAYLWNQLISYRRRKVLAAGLIERLARRDFARG